MIHPSSVVKTKNIGENVHIGPFCHIDENVIIEDNCILYGHVSIGAPAQYKPRLDSDNGTPIVIGAGTEMREFVTVNRPSTGRTIIGENCLLMANVHIPHDCVIENDVTFVVGAAIGGHSKIGEHCYLGLNCSMHNKAVLGAYSVVAASSFFKGESPEGIIWAGVPSRPLKVNRVGIERNAPEDQVDSIIKKAEEELRRLKS